MSGAGRRRQLKNANREELYRRLDQSRRLRNAAPDAVTADRLEELSIEIERQIAVVEARDADAPPT